MSGLQLSSAVELDSRVGKKLENTGISYCIEEENKAVSCPASDREDRAVESFSTRLEAALAAIRLDQPVVAGGNPLPLPPLETQALGESSRVITAANAETTTEEALYALALAQGLDPQVVAGVLWPGQAATALTAKGEPGGGGTDPSGILVRDSQLAFAVPPAWAALRGGEANAMPVGFSIELATNPPAGIERMNGAVVAGLDAAAISTMMPPGSPSTNSQALSTVATAAGPAAGLNPLLQAAIASPGPDALGSQVRGSSPAESMTLAALTRGARPGEPSLAESKVTTPAGVASLPDTRPDLGAPSGLLRSPIADAASAQADRSARPLLTNPSAPLGSALVAPVTRGDLPASESKRDLVRSSPTSGANEGTDGAVDGPTDAVLALRASTNRGILGALQSSAPSAAEWMGRQFRGDPLGLGGPPPQSPSNPLAALAAQPLSTPLRRLADDGSSSGTDFGLGVGSSRQDSVDVSDLQQGPQQATRTEADRELARHRLSEALSSRMLAQVSRGEWDLQIDLKPGDLGHVKIEMSLHNGRLEAVFDAPNPAARALIGEGLERLKLDLEKAGMNVASLGMQQFSGGAGGGKPTPGRFERRAESGQGDSTRGQPVEESTATAQSTSDRILDVRV